MKAKGCEQEQLVAYAIKNNCFSNSLRTHLAECPECQQAAQLATWFQGRLQLSFEGAAAIPYPQIMRLKAQNWMASRATVQVLRPFEFYQWGVWILMGIIATVELLHWAEALSECIQSWQVKMRLACDSMGSALDLKSQLVLLFALCLITGLATFRSWRAEFD